MPIKYAEVTVIFNLEKESYGRSLKRYFGYHVPINECDTILLTFEGDTTIHNVKEEYIDKQYNFGPIGFNRVFPIYFEFGDKYTAFYKSPIRNNNGNLSLNFSKTFAGNINYANVNFTRPSEYNVIYTLNDHKTGSLNVDAFSILHIQSSKENKRFALAYENNYFDTSDIIYLVNNFFMKTVP